MPRDHTVSTRLTSEGRGALLFTVMLAVVAAVSGNNLLYLLVSTLVAVWLGGLWVGTANLRGLTALRRAPTELYACEGGVGKLEVRSQGRGLPSFQVEVWDVGTTAFASVDRVERGAGQGVRTAWRFEARGIARLSALRLTSRFPLGWLEHAVQEASPEALLVYPSPLRGGLDRADIRDGHSAEPSHRVEPLGSGDFSGLRPYTTGDRMHAIHWRTTARVGEWMVAQRTGEQGNAVVIRLSEAGDWETEIRRAAAAVLGAGRRGWRVGLEVPAAHGAGPQTYPVRAGWSWYRTLLDALARLPKALP